MEYDFLRVQSYKNTTSLVHGLVPTHIYVKLCDNYFILMISSIFFYLFCKLYLKSR